MPAKKPVTKGAKSRKPAPAPRSRKPASRKQAARPKPLTPARKPLMPAKKTVVPVRPVAAAPTPAPTAPKNAAGGDREPVRAPSAPATAAVSPERARPPARVVATAVHPAGRPLPAAANEGEEGDGNEPGSLLAGPRNVQPYTPRRGEQYMSKDQLEHFRQILVSWKRDLMEEVDRTVSHMKDEAANFPDPNDRATQEEEFSLELRTRDRERKLIRKIDEALKRVEDGSYGYCLETGEEIGIKRLEARPVATLSIEAQERRERRERQYGDRDDRYR
jgi:DnaK suppressor protein